MRGDRDEFIDASVIGSPPTKGRKPRLYLSGSSGAIEYVEEVFAGTAVTTYRLGDDLGQASALKLAYTAFQKASRALAAMSIGLARHHGVDQELLDVAGKRAGSYLLETEYVAKTATRSWR